MPSRIEDNFKMKVYKQFCGGGGSIFGDFGVVRTVVDFRKVMLTFCA